MSERNERILVIDDTVSILEDFEKILGEKEHEASSRIGHLDHDPGL